MDFAQGAAPAVLGLRALASADAVELADALSACGHSWILGPEYGSLSFRAVLTGKRKKSKLGGFQKALQRGDSVPEWFSSWVRGYRFL